MKKGFTFLWDLRRVFSHNGVNALDIQRYTMGVISTAVFVLLLLCCFSRFGSSASDNGGTLLDIKKSFRNVDNVLYDWTDSSSDYCSWRGIFCDNVTFDIVALNLSGLNLGGEISPTIGDLKGLVSIDLRWNHLSGKIPDEIGECSSLHTLNQLIGPIPSTLSQIPNLKILDMDQNKLSGEIPRLIYWNEVLQYLFG